MTSAWPGSHPIGLTGDRQLDPYGQEDVGAVGALHFLGAEIDVSDAVRPRAFAIAS